MASVVQKGACLPTRLLVKQHTGRMWARRKATVNKVSNVTRGASFHSDSGVGLNLDVRAAKSRLDKLISCRAREESSPVCICAR
jgi:hypothetical protein